MMGAKLNPTAATGPLRRDAASPRFLCAKERKRGWLLLLAASLFGLFYGAFFSEGLLFGFLCGFLTGVCIAVLELFWVRRKRGEALRRRSMLVYVGLLTALWMAIILLNMTLIRHWLGMDHDLSLGWMFTREFGGHFLFSLSMVFLFNFVLRVNAFLGGGSLAALVLGRYQEPVDEKLAFLILDIAGSTRLTETLGDVNTQRLIARFFFDVSERIDHFGGEVHRYVGDQMVVTWRYDRQPDFCHLLYCLDAIYRLLDVNKAGYEQAYGAAPAFRVGLHGGHVLASEVGDQKRELAYFGDTINVAAGLQQLCKTQKTDILISSSLLQGLMLPPSLTARSVGPLTLKGKHNPIAAHALVFAHSQDEDPERAASQEPASVGFGSSAVVPGTADFQSTVFS